MLQPALEYSFRNYLDIVGEIMKSLIDCNFVNSGIDKQQQKRSYKAMQLYCFKKYKE